MTFETSKFKVDGFDGNLKSSAIIYRQLNPMNFSPCIATGFCFLFTHGRRLLLFTFSHIAQISKEKFKEVETKHWVDGRRIL